MKSLSLNFLLLLLCLASFGFQSCESDKTPAPSAAEQLEAAFFKAFEEYRMQPVPRPIFDEQTDRDAMDKKVQEQDQAYNAIVAEEVKRREAAGTSDSESFQAFMADTKAQVYSADVLDYKQQVHELVAPSRAAMENIHEIKMKLASYHPNLAELDNYEAYQWLSDQRGAHN